MVKFTSTNEKKVGNSMKNEDFIIEKICSFYVNDWHLTTMTLPRINKQIEENIKIVTLLEKGIKNNIIELLSKMNLSEELKKKILDIDWTSNETCKYSDIEKKLQKSLKKQSKIEIFVNGSNEYIQLINEAIEKYAKKNIKKLKNKEISVVNCYEVTQFSNISEILNKHELILNTSGTKQIEEVFTGYKKIS